MGDGQESVRAGSRRPYGRLSDHTSRPFFTSIGPCANERVAETRPRRLRRRDDRGLRPDMVMARKGAGTESVSMRRTNMNVRPLRDRVLVKRVEAQEQR